MDIHIALFLILSLVIGLVGGYLLGVRKQFKWGEFVKQVRWPAAVALTMIAIVFLIEYHQPISELIGRANSVDVQGLKITLNRPGPTMLVDQDVVDAVSHMSPAEIGEFMNLGANSWTFSNVSDPPDRRAIHERLVALKLYTENVGFDPKYNMVTIRLAPTSLAHKTSLYLRAVLATTVNIGH